MERQIEEQDDGLSFHSCPVMNFENGQRKECISPGLMLRVLFDYDRARIDAPDGRDSQSLP